MADLSPAAQAVLDAMWRSYDHETTRRLLAAAVLRAAVGYCARRRDVIFDALATELVIVADDLLAIADELEGKDNDY